MTFPKCSHENLIEFEKNGYLHIKNFFSPDSCSKICKVLELLDPTSVQAISSSRSTFFKSSDSLDPWCSGLTYLQKASLFIPEICGIKNLPLLLFSSMLLGVNDVFYLEDEVHVRQPYLCHEIPAHQDNFYFALKCPKALTCYVYLTNQDRTSGGLGFLPGPISSCTDDHDPSATVGFSSYKKSIEFNRKEDFVYPLTSVGDVIFHHSNSYHRAFANTTRYPSAALSVRVFSNDNLSQSELIQSKYSANLLFNRT